MDMPSALPTLFRLPSDVIYLDTAAHAPRLQAVDSAGRAAWEAGIAPWLPPVDEWLAQVETVRALASRMFTADAREDADGVALVPSVAYALTLAAQALPVREGGTVLVADGAFPSDLLPWQRRCAQAGARVHMVPRGAGADGFVAALQRGGVDVVSVPQAHWRDGRLLDIDRIAAAARDHGVPLVLDLSQSLGVLPCDVDRWRPAFVASVGYKWLLGGKGLAFLWASPEWRERAEPLEQHWQAREPAAPWRFEADAPPPYRRGGRRFDAGEIADPLRLAIAEAGLRQVLEWTPAAIARRLQALTSRLRSRLADGGLGDWCVADGSPHIVGLTPPADRLDAARDAMLFAQVICTDRGGVLRLAPHLHIVEEQIDAAAEALLR